MTPQRRVARFLDKRLQGLAKPPAARPGLIAELALGSPLSPERLTKCVRLACKEMKNSVDQFHVRDEYEKRRTANGQTPDTAN
jgi:hypothetical protein